MKKTEFKIDEIVSKKETQIIDSNTGELLEVITDYDRDQRVLGPDGDFTLLFTQILGAFKRLSKGEIMVLSYLVLDAGYNTNMVSVTKHQYEQMQQFTGYQVDSLRNAVSKLRKLGILIGYGSGQYLVHPYIGWRGKTKERRKCVEKLSRDANKALGKK